MGTKRQQGSSGTESAAVRSVSSDKPTKRKSGRHQPGSRKGCWYERCAKVDKEIHKAMIAVKRADEAIEEGKAINRELLMEINKLRDENQSLTNELMELRRM